MSPLAEYRAGTHFAPIVTDTDIAPDGVVVVVFQTKLSGACYHSKIIVLNLGPEREGQFGREG